MKLRGTFTALVTPFNADGSVDFGALDALVDYQLAGNISGLVPCGTTGEAVTLTESERFAVIAAVAKKAEGRPVIAGTGTNNTAQSVELHKKAAAHGATHSLAVTPYYNKPTASGLIAHYTAMAEAAPLPVVLYNVPARTGCDMSLDVVCKLAEHPNIVAVKEATGLMDRVTRLRARVPRDFAILSGDDPTAALLGLLGGDGSVSVTSNYAPAETTELVAAAIDGNVSAVCTLQERLLILFDAFFIESNPMPVKAALAMKGLIQEQYRSPMGPMEPANRERLEGILRDHNWL